MEEKVEDNEEFCGLCFRNPQGLTFQERLGAKVFPPQRPPGPGGTMKRPPQSKTFCSRRYPPQLLPPLSWGMNLSHIRPQSTAQGTSMSRVSPIFQFSPQHSIHLQERYLQGAAAKLTFSPDVVAQRGLASFPYLQCSFEHLYDGDPIRQLCARTSHSHPRLHLRPRLPAYTDSHSECTKTPATAQEVQAQSLARSKHQQQKAQALSETSPSQPQLALSKSRSHAEVAHKQDLQPENLSLEKQDSWLEPPEKEARVWEAMVLAKLNKRTARWILNKRPLKPGTTPSKWQNFLHHQYDWSHIRDEITSDSHLKLLAELEREEMAEFELETPPATPQVVVEEKKPEMLLSEYYRLPQFLSQMEKAELETYKNKTTDEINQNRDSLQIPDKSCFQRLVVPRAGKFSLVTDSAFEQEIYLDKIKIIHPIGMKRNQILLENQSRYNKQLCEIFPQTPDRWTSQPVPEAPYKPVKGARRWTALPIPVKELVKIKEAEALMKTRGLKNVVHLLKGNVSWKLEALRKMLQDWKTDWALIIEWRHETIEGLQRRLVNLHNDVRIQAIITCATAALERPRTNTSQEDSEDTETKVSSTQDLPEVLHPALEAALRDKNASVQMAAALCQYAIQSHNPLARDIMQKALQNGNSVDSWAAAQCLALEGIGTYPVIKRIFHQLFNKKDKDTELHSCLLLCHLNKQKTLINTMLAIELNSGEWRERALACRVLAQINTNISSDIKRRLVHMMWSDWKKEVRQAAAQALGQMNLGKEVHDIIGIKLSQGTPQERVESLTLISELKLMTAKLLPSFLKCFSDDYMTVQQAACLAAGALQIHNELVIKCLLNLIQRDPYWKTKALAIRAMVQIGQVSPQLTDLLLWAIHYESSPGVRLEACRSILALKIQGNQVKDTFLHVLLLEDHEAILKEIHKAMKMLKIENEEDQEMIQNIKIRIQMLSEKDSLTQKILKIEAAIKKVKDEAKYVYVPPKKNQEPLKLQTFLQNTLQDEMAPLRRPTECFDIEEVIKTVKPREPSPWIQVDNLNLKARGQSYSSPDKNLRTARGKWTETEPFLFDKQFLPKRKGSRAFSRSLDIFLGKKSINK